MSEIVEGEITADTSSQNDSIAGCKAVLTTQPYNFREKSKTFPLNVGTRKCKVFIGKCCCKPWSYVHLESSFDNPVEKFVTQWRWFSDQHLKTLKKIKMLPWTRRRQFWQPYEKIFDRRPKSFRSKSEQKNKESFSLKLFSPQKFSCDT